MFNKPATQNARLQSTQSVPPSNRLVEALPRKEQKRLLDQCETVDLTSGAVLCTSNETIEFVWFPISGVIALETKMNGHPPMAVGLSGSEGMLGATLVIGIDTAPFHAVVQDSGSALRIAAADFVVLMTRCPTLKRTAQRYLYVMTMLASRSTPCARFHGIEARLAHWLLMFDDRTHEDHFDLTHQYLADMLGVQRSAISLAAHALLNDGLISYSRGRINIVSRPGLQAAACECYAESIGNYARQFPA